MADEDEEPQLDEEPAAAIESEEQERRAEPSLEEAEKLIKNAEPVLRKLRLDPDMAERAGEGFRALREGLSDFLVASDRGAGRHKDTADKIIDLVKRELDREGLTPQERLEFMQAGERMVGQVGDVEKDVRESNARTLTKVVAIAAGAVVGAALLGYLAKEGKLPTAPPIA
ncbi:hypothetical protein [Cryobacterium soli]|uniref:hypothetical protein n=1 Tax=Cryobacterium soli TaxID=2220095 RepID=UPI000E74DE39|nr:hypothetical protein [Cryobacterium soli]